MSFEILSGDCREHMRSVLAPGLVQVVVTSPPYWALRDYGVPGSDWADGWHGVFGNEPTLAQYIAHTLEVFRDIDRVLSPSGVIWWNLGDTFDQNGSKLLIPHRVGIALMDAGWIVRQDVVWAKKSPMPESIGGWSWQRCRVKVAKQRTASETCPGSYKAEAFGVHAQRHCIGGVWIGAAEFKECPGCRKCETTDGMVLVKKKWRHTTAHETILMVTRPGDYFGNMLGARELATYRDSGRQSKKRGEFAGKNVLPGKEGFRAVVEHRNPRSVITLSAEPYKGSHFATFPTMVPYLCLKATTSLAGICPQCRTPFAPVLRTERVPTRPGTDSKVGKRDLAIENGSYANKPNNPNIVGNRDPQRHFSRVSCDGWRPTCGCGITEGVPMTVYDPFGGSGTTAQVAHRMGLHGICSEISGTYRELIQKRIGTVPNCLRDRSRTKKRRSLHPREQSLFAD